MERGGRRHRSLLGQRVAGLSCRGFCRVAELWVDECCRFVPRVPVAIEIQSGLRLLAGNPRCAVLRVIGYMMYDQRVDTARVQRQRGRRREQHTVCVTSAEGLDASSVCSLDPGQWQASRFRKYRDEARGARQPDRR